MSGKASLNVTSNMEFPNAPKGVLVEWVIHERTPGNPPGKVNVKLAADIIQDNEVRQVAHVGIQDGVAQGVVHVHLPLTFLEVDDTRWAEVTMPAACGGTNAGDILALVLDELIHHSMVPVAGGRVPVLNRRFDVFRIWLFGHQVQLPIGEVDIWCRIMAPLVYGREVAIHDHGPCVDFLGWIIFPIRGKVDTGLGASRAKSGHGSWSWHTEDVSRPLVMLELAPLPVHPVQLPIPVLFQH